MSDGTEVMLSSPALFKPQLLILHKEIKNVGCNAYICTITITVNWPEGPPFSVLV